LAGTFFGVSLGPAKKSLIVPRAFEALEASDVVYLMTAENTRTHGLVRDLVGGDKTIRLFRPESLGWGEWGGDPVHAEIAEEIHRHISEDRNVALIAFGDISIYSPYNYLSEHLQSYGIPCELVPGIPYFLAAAGATSDYLVRDEGNLLVAGYDNLEDLDSAFVSASTVVVYAANADGIERARRYALAHALPYAKVVKIGAEGESDEVWDLTDVESKVGSGVVILKRNPQDRVVVRPTVITAAPGAVHAEDLAVETVMKEGIYRSVDGNDLRFTGFFPRTKNAPLLLLFHGGGWQVGSRQQFIAHGEALSSVGLAVVTCDYRIMSRHDATPAESVDDARAAITWILDHAEDLGVDPDRIIVGGASAGGHLALGAFVLPGNSALTDRLAMPRAFVLLNPVSDTSENGYGFDYLKENGLDPVAFDLNRNVSERVAPTLIFHGAEDALVPVQNSFDLMRILEEQGSDVELRSFAGLPHGFFNYRFQGSNRYYYESLERIVDFLTVRDVLPPDASTAIRIVNAADRERAAFDVAQGYRQVTRALEEVDGKLAEMREHIQQLAEGSPDRAAELNRILNNVKFLSTKLTAVKTTLEYCGVDAGGSR
jgi:acetyl esterase/lipase/precorrin-2 methylase